MYIICVVLAGKVIDNGMTQARVMVSVRIS